MALHHYTIPSGAGGVAAVEALGAATAETLIQVVTPSTRWATIIEVGVSFDSATAANQPALVELLLQTTAGTATAVTPLIEFPGTPAALCTAQHHFTAEPTASTIIWHEYITVVGGTFVFQGPLDREIYTMAVSARVGLRVTSPSAVNCRAYLRIEE